MEKKAKKTLVFSALAFMGLAMPSLAQEVYRSDQGHTEVFFGWSHAGVSRQYGEFTRSQATLTLFEDDIEVSTLEATIDATSVFAGFGPMDDMLKSSYLLNVQAHPEIRFVSTSVERTGEETALVSGELTIRGVTRPTTLEVTLTHQGPHPLARNFPDLYSGEWLAFEAKGEVKSWLFDVGPNPTVGLSGPIQIEIRTEMQRRG